MSWKRSIPLMAASMRPCAANFETEIRLFLSSVLLENRSVHGPAQRRLDLRQRGAGAAVRRPRRARRAVPSREARPTRIAGACWAREPCCCARPMATALRRCCAAPGCSTASWARRPPAAAQCSHGPGRSRMGHKPTTVRARLEEHRANPTCKACHGLIDPPGLALENFDNTGRWRDHRCGGEGAHRNHDRRCRAASCCNGPVELRRYLTSRPDQFPTTVTRRLMMYALNREIEYYDMPQVRQIVRRRRCQQLHLRRAHQRRREQRRLPAPGAGRAQADADAQADCGIQRAPAALPRHSILNGD